MVRYYHEVPPLSIKEEENPDTMVEESVDESSINNEDVAFGDEEPEEEEKTLDDLQLEKNDIFEVAKEYINEEKEVNSAEDAIAGALDIIAENIARRRKELGLTQRELAEKLQCATCRHLLSEAWNGKQNPQNGAC